MEDIYLKIEIKREHQVEETNKKGRYDNTQDQFSIIKGMSDIRVCDIIVVRFCDFYKGPY